jgi:hypothetical protein
MALLSWALVMLIVSPLAPLASADIGSVALLVPVEMTKFEPETLSTVPTTAPAVS